MNPEKLKQILETEIKRHTEEIKKHKELFKLRGSKKEKFKIHKHFHKRFQTKNIAKQLGYEFYECCGRVK